MTQLSLFESMPSPLPSESVEVRNTAIKNHVHGVTKNPTARGTYYVYWWQVTVGDRRSTKKRPIRGGRVGSELGESRRGLVQSWIDSGLGPHCICSKLEAFPRSARRSRYAWGQCEELQAAVSL